VLNKRPNNFFKSSSAYFWLLAGISHLKLRMYEISAWSSLLNRREKYKKGESKTGKYAFVKYFLKIVKNRKFNSE